MTSREELVADAMAALEGIDDLPLEEQAQRLQETQAVLADVLTSDRVDRAIPGVGPGR